MRIPHFPHKALHFLALPLCLLFTACATTTPTPLETPSQSLWDTYTAEQNALFVEAEPFRLSGSLRFGPEEDTRRVTYILWGNGGHGLRLDVQAGVGASAAKVQLSNAGLLIYLPQENTAYLAMENQAQALETLGIQLPVSLNELALFLRGHSLRALEITLDESSPLQPKSALTTPNGVVYTLGSGNKQILLELSPFAKPLSLAFNDGWKLNFRLDEQQAISRVDGQNTNGYSLILLIKENQNPQPFSQEQLALAVPRDAMVYLLDKPIQQAAQP